MYSLVRTKNLRQELIVLDVTYSLPQIEEYLSGLKLEASGERKRRRDGDIP